MQFYILVFHNYLSFQSMPFLLAAFLVNPCGYLFLSFSTFSPKTSLKSHSKKLQIIAAYHKVSPRFSLMPAFWSFLWEKVFLMQPARSPASPAIPSPQVMISFSLSLNFWAVFLQSFWYSLRFFIFIFYSLISQNLLKTSFAFSRFLSSTKT